MESEMTNINTVAKMELGFVDHVEYQIQSPEKESLSPKTSPSCSNSAQQLDVELHKSDSIEVNDDHLETVELNTCDNSADITQNEFTDRQEVQVSMEGPDTIVSPRTIRNIVADLSNMSDDDEDMLLRPERLEVLHISEEIDAPDSDSKSEDSEDASNINIDTAKSHSVEAVELDSVNNNLDQASVTVLEIAQPDAKVQKDNINANVAEIKFETDDSVKVVEDHVKLVPASPEDSNINLYWYSNTMSLDPIEIQQFKKTQVENDENIEATDSPLHDDYYYKSKLEAPNKQVVEENRSVENMNMSLSNDGIWSSAFQSASSRALDVASELTGTSDPKEVKNRENISIRESESGSDHPWGLIADSRLINDSHQSKTDFLPTLESLSEDLNINNIVDSNDMISKISDNSSIADEDDGEKENVISDVDEETVTIVSEPHDMDIKDENPADALECREFEAKTEMQSNQLEDQADAIGYMELKDKTEIQRSQLEDQADAVGYVELKDKTEIQSSQLEDQADAVGYMELKDKTEIQRSRLEDQADAIGYMELKDKTEIQSSQLEDQADAIGYMELKDKTEIQSSQLEDQADAIGYMELKDKTEIQSSQLEDQADAIGYMELKDKTEIQSIQLEDQADAIGYMELKDKTEIQSSQLEDQADAIGYMELKDKTEIQSSQLEDQADAIGYMELKDKTEIQRSQLEDQADAIGYMELKDKTEIQSSQLEDQADAIGYMELKDKTEIQSSQLEDQADAIGYMELKDKTEIQSSQFDNRADAVGYMELKDKIEIQRHQPDSAAVEDKSFKGAEQKEADDTTGTCTEQETEIIVSNDNTELANDVTDSVGDMELSDRDIIKNIKISTLNTENIETEDIDNENTYDTIVIDIIQSTESDNMTRKENSDENNKIDDIKTLESQICTDSNILSEKIDLVNTVDEELQKTQEPVSEMATNVNKIYEPIEVERKFRIADDTEVMIIKMDGKLENIVNFTDKYLDNNSYTLTLQDCWLRIRNAKYELKTNAATSQSSQSTQYNETEDENAIKEFLIKTFEVANIVNVEAELSDIISECGLEEFAVFETTRKTYKLADCTVDLDLTDFGYQVGEIEVMVYDPADVTHALDIIEEVAAKLGLHSLQNI